jgi:patatin-like phospholipase/acyl hydrolase
LAIFKILTIDGGGIKGAFPAAFLTAVERTTNKRLVDYFDLIVGTSTGGIIALGLGIGKSASEILAFYREYGPTIFSQSNGVGKLKRFFRHLVRPIYSPEPLEKALRNVFGEKKLGDSICRLVIPSFDANRADVYLYKTAHHPRLRTDYRVPVWEVAMATAAAPTYFPSYTNNSKIRFIDGGIWANNPTMVALVEAISLLGIQLSDLYVLSLGCTEAPISVERWKSQKGGKLAWAYTAIDLLIHGQSIVANNQTFLLLGQDHFMRINEMVEPGRFKLDNAKTIDDLEAHGAALARHKVDEVEKKFLQEKVPPFVPIYTA